MRTRRKRMMKEWIRAGRLARESTLMGSRVALFTTAFGSGSLAKIKKIHCA